MPANGFDPAAHPALAGLAGRLRELAGDASYAAGRDYLRRGLVKHGAVASTTAYATVSGSTDYRISVAFGASDGSAGDVKVTCTCPAYRRNRYCKHVVAVAVALVERPGDFVVGEAPPEVQAPAKAPRTAARTAKARAPKQSPEALRATGLETVDRLLADLADGGLAGMGPDKLALLDGAAELVRALKLRRLGNQLMALRHAAGQDRPQLEAGGFARLLADLWLTRRATGAHLSGAAQMEAPAAEELLGKTWREEELEPAAGLELLEVASEAHSDGEFRVETSYLAEIGKGALYVERQITPARLRAQPKPRHRLKLLVEQAALYPGEAPRRLRLVRFQRVPLLVDDVTRWLARVPADVAALRVPLLVRAEQPFGPPEVPVAFRPAALLERDGRRLAVDPEGRALGLTCPPRWMEGLAPLLADGPTDVTLFGLLSLDGRGAGAGDDASGSGVGAMTLACLVAVSAGFAWPGGPVYPG